MKQTVVLTKTNVLLFIGAALVNYLKNVDLVSTQLLNTNLFVKVHH